MEYVLNRLNVLLIALVGALCVYQWAGEKKADAQIVELRRVSQIDEDHITSQDLAIRGAREDIAEFKQVIVELKRKSDAGDVQVRQDKARIFTLELEEKRSAAEVNLLVKALAAYKQGVATRDNNIHLLLDQRQQLINANGDAVHKANQAITAYDDLASKYATLVSQYNDLAKRYKTLLTPRPTDKSTGPDS